jgi:phage tail-like protein
MPGIMGAVAKGAIGAVSGALASLLDLPVACSLYFRVQIDSFDIGAFNTCDGLGIEVECEQRTEGGNNGMVWHLPTRLKYTNVRLTRPLTMASMMLMGAVKGQISASEPTTATIEAMPIGGQNLVPVIGGLLPIMAWSLTGVRPVRWSGPRFTPLTGEIAIETLELSHEGFLGPSISIPNLPF